MDLRKAIDLADSLDMAQKQSATYSSTKLLHSASATTDRQELDDLNHQFPETRDPLLSHLLSRKIRREAINDFAFSVAVLGIIFEKTVLRETTFAHHVGLKVIFLRSVAKAKLSVDQS